ncbi:hypothetical protein NMY22_g20200 [Coprinellus aureogranulatus]|nr:hypothetical protein NMY22_g20200 [Coprinellus aureogranulatus]
MQAFTKRRINTVQSGVHRIAFRCFGKKVMEVSIDHKRPWDLMAWIQEHKNPHDEEGEGEEEEETVHAIKSKAFRMKKADEKGGPGWVEIGYGVLRLKKHKETSARRMLLRNSTTGKININFALYPGLKPSLAKKAVTFIGHDNGVAQTYSVRVPNEEAAKDLKEALEREIAFVKAKESE